VDAVSGIIRNRVVPAALELIDGESLEAVAQNLGVRSLAPEGTAAILLLDVDGVPAAVTEEAVRVEAACRAAGATEILRARDEAERAGAVARAPRAVALAQDGRAAQVQPRHGRAQGAHPGAVRARERIRDEFRLRIPLFGHAGTATSTSTSWWTPTMRTRFGGRTRPSTCCSEG
jgi:glycolate oxidase